MFSKYLQSVEWLGIFAVASMLLFIIAFGVIIIWIIKLDKKYINEAENLPLEE